MATLAKLQQFHGIALGAIFGDCLGAHFEHDWRATPYADVIKYFERVRSQVDNKVVVKGSVLHTDDSCMTFDLGLSLIKYQGYNAEDVARNFCETYFASTPQRFYGGNVATVFSGLKQINYSGDVCHPASQQFDGSGSYGNGSAMRVCPVQLFYHNNIPCMVDLVAQQSKITHSNPRGINGAILQALAIEKAMNSEKIEDPVQFCNELFQQLKEVTPVKDDLRVFKKNMKTVESLLKSKDAVAPSEINRRIGSGVSAHKSVPVAIFSFLYTLDKERIPELSKYNGLLRATIFSVGFSFDSDTVGSMAAAIAGAYYGVDAVPDQWKFACEHADEALKMADDLCRINQEQSSQDKKGTK